MTVDVSKFLQKPDSRWKSQEDTALYEEQADDNLPDLPRSCRCVSKVLSYSDARSRDHIEAEEAIDFKSVGDKSPAQRRPSHASTSQGDSGGGGSSSSGQPSSSSVTAPTPISPTIAATPCRARAFETSPTAPAEVNIASSGSYERYNSNFDSSRSMAETLSTRVKSSSKEQHVALASLSKPSSKMLGEDTDGTAEPSEAEDKEEHERAIAAFLREYGFLALHRPRRTSIIGSTYPLHRAASLGLVRMTDLMIKANANPRQKNSWGQTPLDVARRCNRKGSHEGVLRILNSA